MNPTATRQPAAYSRASWCSSSEMTRIPCEPGRSLFTRAAPFVASACAAMVHHRHKSQAPGPGPTSSLGSVYYRDLPISSLHFRCIHPAAKPVQSEAEALTQVGFRALCAASPHPVTHDRVKCSGDTTNDSLVHNVEVGSDSLDPPTQPWAVLSNLGSQIPEAKPQGLTSPRPPDQSCLQAFRSHNLVFRLDLTLNLNQQVSTSSVQRLSVLWYSRVKRRDKGIIQHPAAELEWRCAHW